MLEKRDYEITDNQPGLFLWFSRIISLESFSPLLPIFLGILAFVFITGGKIIYPTFVNWLLNTCDSGNSFIAWQFFRHTPLLQSPLASNYPYGMGIGGSLSYAEPLLLFAIPFKLISNLLPEQFQYMGMWLLLCFILQAVFSWLLLAKITTDNSIKFLASAFFVLAPPFLCRLHGHPQFLGQWLILAGIFFYFSDHFRKRAWPVFIAIAAVVHPYLLLMLLILWSADVGHRKLTRELNYKDMAYSISFVSALVLLIIWQAGYFMIPANAITTGGFGLYRMNLLSLFNPRDDAFLINDWSHILKNQSRGTGDFEGFMYLGIGMLLLALTGFLRCIESLQFNGVWRGVRKNSVLLLTATLLTLLALSNQIAFGSYELFHYELPGIVGVFRASGRLFWPVFYLIYLFIFYLVIKNNKKNTARLVIAICLLIQIVDSGNIYNQLRGFLSQAKPYESSLQNPFWGKVANKYKKIVYILPGLYRFSLKPLVYYASLNHMSINIGYFARTDVQRLHENKMLLMDSILQSKFDDDTLYVFNDKNLLGLFSTENIKTPYQFAYIDNFFVFAPKLEFPFSNDVAISLQKTAQDYAYQLGTVVDFSTGESNFNDYLLPLGGFSIPEGKGTWTVGDSSLFLLRLAEKPNSDLVLKLNVMPFLTEKHPVLDVEVRANQNSLGYLHFDLKSKFPLSEVTIPQAIIRNDKLIKFELRFKEAISPAEVGFNSDVRKLGVFITSLQIDKKNTI